DRLALLQQSGVVWCRAADLFAERDDLAVQVIELAAGTPLKALQGRRAISAVGWEFADEPLAGDAVAEPLRKRRHQAKGARRAALVETEPAKLGRSDTFANRRDRQPLRDDVAEGLAARAAGNG